MATQKLEEKVQPHDKDAESSKTGCRNPSRAQGNTYEQVPALICGSDACRIFARSCQLGGGVAPYEQNTPQKYFGKKSEFAH